MASVDLIEEWMTTAQVADHFDTSARAVTHMIQQGRLTARKMGWQWLVHPSDLPDSWPPKKVEDPVV